MELPIEFLDAMRELLGEEFEDYRKSFANPCFQGIRINTAKINAGQFQEMSPFSLRRIPWAENGFYYGKEAAVTKHPWYYAGLYYVQEPSAMIPAAVLPVEKGDFVLDLCAAPGGKATELGARLEGSGMLLANDISHSRAKALLKNLELFGIRNAYVTSEASGKLAEIYPEYFDKILIDAPCSGEGMFRREPSMVKDWTEKGPDYYVPIQRQLLLDGAAMLKPGGKLVYSTCTFSRKENEENITFLLEHCPDMELQKPEYREGFAAGKKKGFENCIRILPYKAQGEGHFAALLGKKERKEADRGQKRVGKERGKAQAFQSREMLLRKYPELNSFIGKLPKWFDGSFAVSKERVYLLPEGTSICPAIRYLRTGLYAGDIQKGRFTPSQALAMCLNAEDFPEAISFDAEDERVLRYLKGETLDLTGTIWEAWKGWVLVCADGYGLGWAKAVNGTLRNKYYAGWRMQA